MKDFPAYLCVSSICGQALLATLFFTGVFPLEFARFIWGWLFLVMIASFIAQFVVEFQRRRGK